MRRTETQHISTTISAAGDQDWSVSTHGGAGAAGSHVALRIGDAMIWLHDRAAVRTWVRAFNVYDNRSVDLLSIPDQIDLAPALTRAGDPVIGIPTTVAVHATGRDSYSTHTERHVLLVQVGRITWAILDKRALASLRDAWHYVDAIGQVVLPDRHLTPASRD